MKIIHNNFVPFPGFAAVNFCGLLFVRRCVNVTPRLLNHEAIHTAQQRELLFVPFFVLYVMEWVVRLFQYGFDSHKAYRAISFEREAYAHDAEPDYLSRRRLFSQWRTSANTK